MFETGNSFTGNTASSSGGAVKWNYNKPLNLTAPTYSSNSASNYGGNYAAFAQKLSRLTDAEYNAHR
jgi:hypothetical protein